MAKKRTNASERTNAVEIKTAAPEAAPEAVDILVIGLKLEGAPMVDYTAKVNRDLITCTQEVKAEFRNFPTRESFRGLASGFNPEGFKCEIQTGAGAKVSLEYVKWEGYTLPDKQDSKNVIKRARGIYAAHIINAAADDENKRDYAIEIKGEGSQKGEFNFPLSFAGAVNSAWAELHPNAKTPSRGGITKAALVDNNKRIAELNAALSEAIKSGNLPEATRLSGEIAILARGMIDSIA